MDNECWNKLLAKKAELDCVLGENRITLSEWFAAVDPILHLREPDLDDALHRYAAEDIRRMEDQAAPLHGARPNILVVRRVKTARENAQALLEGAGCAVTAVGDGIEGLVELVFGRYDVLVTGAILPHLSGAELIELKNLLRIDTPAVMHTVMPLELSGGAFLEREDCVCAGKIAEGGISITTRDFLESDDRMIARVKQHLKRQGWRFKSDGELLTGGRF